MKHYGDKQPIELIDLAIDGGGSDISKGALIKAGTTAEQDMGVYILADAAGTDAVGYINELHDFSVDGDSTPEVATANYVKHQVAMIKPGDVLEVDYDLSDTVAATGGSTTTVTATSLEDNLDGGWIYFVSGTSIGQLAYITASAAGTATLGTVTTAPVASDTFIKIMKSGAQLVKLNTARTKIGSDAAAGTWTCFIIKNQISYTAGDKWEDLDILKHHNMQGLNSKNVKFRALVFARNLASATID